jgi:hypothetical protein
MAQPLTEPRNRLVLLTEATASNGTPLTVNGIDFIELKSVDATTLFVHFLNTVPVQTSNISVQISGGDRITGITVARIGSGDWSIDAEGRPVLALHVSEPGDFSIYTLTISNAPLDAMYSSAPFSFKVLCPSPFDCAPVSECCTPSEPPLPAIDYLAKDFQSFKLALTDFSAQRYPAWQERSEADFGVMFMEALCGIADELSYLQDRVAAEAALLTVTQRRSLVSMARLVDYEPQPVMSATTTIQCNVSGTTVPAGTRISAARPDGVVVPFEIGTGLADTTQYPVRKLWNDGIQPYWFDDSQQCLQCGAVAMWLLGHGFGFTAGTPLLIQTDLPGQSIREVVNITTATEIVDTVYLTSTGNPTPVTYITWATADALKRDHDLTNTHVAGNLLPATQGQRFSESFAVGTPPASAASLSVAVARWGPNATSARPQWIIRYPLSRTCGAQASALLGLSELTTGVQPRLTWLMPGANSLANSFIDPDIVKPLPELAVSRRLPEPQAFTFATSLLDASATEPAHTVDPGAWRVVGVNSQTGLSQWEYDGDQGDTLRFGDGLFGLQPADGDVYDVEYRIGVGAAGNVAPDAIRNLGLNATAYLVGARNPFIVTSGADQETSQHIQRMAPQAFRAVQYRAVRAEDYEAAAKTLPWVLAAGTSFRWTGSWLTVFTTVDPSAEGTPGTTVSESNQEILIELLNRRKLAGYESYAPPPVLISIDLRITVCVTTGWLDGDVETGVLSRLADKEQPDGSAGFFYADAFTFGTPLYRSALEAAIQAVPGVNGVLDVEYRQPGSGNVFQPLPEVLQPGTSQILRVQNDPNFPERGTIRVIAEGGR